MKVAPAVAEVLGVVDDAAGSHTEGYGEVLSVAHAPDAPPAAAPAAPVEEEATAPRTAEMERGPAAADAITGTTCTAGAAASRGHGALQRQNPGGAHHAERRADGDV